MNSTIKVKVKYGFREVTTHLTETITVRELMDRARDTLGFGKNIIVENKREGCPMESYPSLESDVVDGCYRVEIRSNDIA